MSYLENNIASAFLVIGKTIFFFVCVRKLSLLCEVSGLLELFEYDK